MLCNLELLEIKYEKNHNFVLSNVTSPQKLIENFEWMNAEQNKMDSKPAYNLTVSYVQR